MQVVQRLPSCITWTGGCFGGGLPSRPARCADVAPCAGASSEQTIQRGRLDGVEKALGAEGLERLKAARVCIVGIGGVGSWTAEALARSGVGHLALVDLDEVCVSNVNRQIHALTSTVGELKGQAMARRIADINPESEVNVVADFLDKHNVGELLSPAGQLQYDFVVDAVDTLIEKAIILDFCCRRAIPVITVGGTGGVTTPEGLRVVDLNLAGQDRLLFRTRKQLRKHHGWASEPPYQRIEDKPLWGIKAITAATESSDVPKGQQSGISCNAYGGSLCYVTGAVGLLAAAYVANTLAAGGAEATGEGSASARPWEGINESQLSEIDRKKLDKHRAVSRQNVAQPSVGTNVEGKQAGKPVALTMFDAHCHPQLGKEGADFGFDNIPNVAVMSTQESDWDACCAIGAAHPEECCVALGVHPWFAHKFPCPEATDTTAAHQVDSWLSRLNKRLQANPGFVVGEIGLDRKWTTPDTGAIEYEAQKEVFRLQMDLAARLGRPAVLHCVHAYGDLSTLVRGPQPLPPAMYIHSYGGSADFVKSLVMIKGGIGGRFYFGFSAFVNLRGKKARAAIAAVPDDRLLLESDETEGSVMQDDCWTMLQVYAEVKGWSIEEANARTTENAKRFYSTRA